MNIMSITGSIAATVFAASLAHAQNVPEKKMHRFDLGTGSAQSGWSKVTPDTAYTEARGYGILEGIPKASAAGVAGKGDCLSSDRPFTFAVALPEGNYDVVLTLGEPGAASTTIIQVESRRLISEGIRTQPGESVILPFTVNVRVPSLKSGGQIGLKGDEKEKRNWDGKLTLTFSGSHPAVSAIEIRPAPDAVTVYLAGDSTVTDQEHEPWSAWGQILPAFFRPGVAIANHAQSGESLSSFTGERRWEKILDTLRAGDYVFIQFAHNDQKPGPAHADPFTTYTERLKGYLDDVRKRKATPVLVTPMHRRRFDETRHLVDTLGDYPEAMHRLARVEKVALIDLNGTSRLLFEAMGAEGSKRAFVHYPAGSFAGQKEALKDDTHFSNYGAYELARCMVEGIRANLPPLADQLRANVPVFDPLKPDSVSPLAPLTVTHKEFNSD
ncbi:MAG: rhamnogalacturonan acetylesterase [Fibrella sp.]|nr:rhamnogalacturonan acetylesterase [Armatimonadota bacterium]